MNTLEKLFGSNARVKILRLFLLNPEQVYTAKETARMTRVSSAAVSRELRTLRDIGFVKKSSKSEEVKKRKKIRKKRVQGFMLSSAFPVLAPLRNLLITASPVSRERMIQYFKRHGKMQLVGVAGVFFGADDAGGVARQNIDLLAVGDGVKRSKLEQFVSTLESEIGKELVWASFSPAEFEYRMAMHDKFLRDFFDYPHEFLINKLGIK